MAEPGKVILYITMSLDGYIAQPNDDLSFLSIVEQEGEDYGYNAFVETVGAIVLGRKTYDWVMQQIPEWHHADIDTYVVTRTPRPSRGKLHYYNGDLRELLQSLKAKTGKNIFIDGGAGLVNSLLREDLIDEYIISVIPIFVGDGVRLFHSGNPEQQLELTATRTYESGLVQLHYRRKRTGNA